MLLIGALRLAGVLAAACLRPGAFLAAFFVLTAFFLLTFFLADGFFFAAFMAAGFLAARFLLERLLAADFLASAFLFAIFFLLADFFAAGFFRAIAFFLDAVFADIFFFVTLGFFPAVFLLVDGLLFAAFFREALASLRFLLAVFFAGIFNSGRSEKNAQLYIAWWYMEARISRFFCGRVSASFGRLLMAFLRLPDAPEVAILAALSALLPRLATIVLCCNLHYTTLNSRAWA